MVRNRFIIKKRAAAMKPQKKVTHTVAKAVEAEEPKPKKENSRNKKSDKKEGVMTTSEKIEIANAVLNRNETEVKKIKKDKGLIERADSAKTILTEDNKELLID